MSGTSTQKTSKSWFEVVDSAVPIIKIDGPIAKFTKNNSNDFIRAVDAMEAKGVRRAIVDFHTVGGSMFEGFRMGDHMRNSSVKFSGKVSGMCASMGIPMLLSCDEREAVQNSTLMTHKPQGEYRGEADGMESYVKNMRDQEQKLVDLFVQRTGQDESVVKSWLKAGAETWFTAKEAENLGLIDRVIPGGKTKSNIPTNLANLSEYEVYNLYETNNKISNTMKDFIILAIALLAKEGVEHTLNEESTAQEVAAVFEKAFTAKNTSIDNLKDQLKDGENAKVEGLVDSAIAEGKITAAQKESYMSLGKADFDNTKNILDQMKGVVDINNRLERNKGKKPSDPSNKGAKNGRQEWGFEDWSKNDPEGLKQLKNSDPEKYTELFNAEYNVDPE